MTNWLKNHVLRDFFYPACTAALLGILLTFAYAPYEIFPLAVLAPAGLLAFWLQASPKRSFWIGFAFGLGFFGAGVYWVFISIHVIGEVPSALAGVITASMIAFLALYPASVGYLLNRYFPHQQATKILCAFPAIWTFSEWVRSWFLTGFPWLNIGYSQTNSPLKGYAPIFSVYGVAFAVMFSSALIVHGVCAYKQKNFRAIYTASIGMALMWILGGLLAFIPWTHSQGKPISVALVQGNIPQTIKWSPEHLQLSMDTYAQLTEPLWGNYNLIIWPEAAIPLPLDNAQSYVNSLDAEAVKTHTQLVFGIPVRTRNGKSFYNTILTVGKYKTSYLKRHLVPFGEYTPFETTFARAFNFMNIPISITESGPINQAPLQFDNVKILASICYEIAFPSLIRTVDKSTSLLLSITNDAWFGESNAQAQHLQMAEMRAMELGRPVLFVSNDGITAMIGPDGKLMAHAPQRKAYVLTGEVQPMYGITPWMRNGTDPIFFIAICLLLFALRKQYRYTQQQKLHANHAEATSSNN